MSTNASKLSLLAPNVNTSGTVEATTLDGLDSSQFLRSDTSDLTTSSDATYTTSVINTRGDATGHGLYVQTRWNVADNYVARFTSNSGNTEMLAIKGDGKVGIGNTSPEGALHVSYGSITEATTVTGVNDYSNPVVFKRASAGGKNAILLKGSDNISSAIEQGRYNSASTWESYIKFLAHNAGTGGGFATTDLSSVMMIRGSGLVGINKNDPQYALDITGPGTSGGITMRLADASSSADSKHLYLQRYSSTASIGIAGSQANDPLSISRSGGYDLSVTSSGMVLINNATPSTNYNDASSVVKLQINGDQHFSRQSAKIYFGDVTSEVPLSIGEGNQNQSGSDADHLTLYGRNRITFYNYDADNSAISTEYFRIGRRYVRSGSENYSTYTKTIQTINGGSQLCRFIEDCYGKWVLVGKFAADASVSIGGIWSSVRGLSTSEAQNDTTAFSADFGDTFPSEVRIMGATDFSVWKETRTIDFIYKVPTGRRWKNFFTGGNTDGTFVTAGTARRGFTTNGTYDGFGRWSNPNNTQIGMSDGDYNCPEAAFTTPTTNAFNFNTAQDAKLTAIHEGLYSGQDVTETTGFGYDDNIRGFFDVFPNLSSNMGSGATYSSAVWVLIKLT